MKDAPDFLPEESKEAIHAAKNAAQAVEIARQEQIEAAVRANDERMAGLFQSALREVFGPTTPHDTEQMHVLLPKIPLLCLTVENMKLTLEEIKSNQTWAVRLILGAVIMAALGTILIK